MGTQFNRNIELRNLEWRQRDFDERERETLFLLFSFLWRNVKKMIGIKKGEKKHTTLFAATPAKSVVDDDD